MFRRISFFIVIFTFIAYSSSLAVEIPEEQFQLEEELLLLEERFVITPTKTKKKAREAPAMITVITAEQIRNMGARNIMDVLKIVPGINIARQIEGIWEGIEVRGIKTTFSEKVLLLQDGHTLNNLLDGGPSRYFDDMVVNNIKQIEIIRGPGSAIYGANAFVAVINVITKKQDVDGVEIKTGAGSFDTQQHSVLFGKQKGKFGVAGYLDYFDTNGPRLQVEEDILSPNSYSDAPGHTDAWKEKKDFNLNLSYEDFTLWGKYIEKTFGPYIGINYALNDESRIINRNFYGELLFNHSFKNRSNLLARFYGDHIDEDVYWEIYPEGYPNFPDGFIGSPRFKINTFGTELKVDYETAKTNLLTVGTLFEKTKLYKAIHIANFTPNTNAPLGGVQDISDWGNFTKEAKRQIWALYIQNDLDLLDKYGLELLLGARYDHYSDFGGVLTPRTSLLWQTMPKLDCKVLYGQAFRAPSFAELYVENNPAIIGKPDLEPEKLWTVEVGFDYRITSNISLSANYFHTKIKDVIQLIAREYFNTGTITTNGVEAEIRANLYEGSYGFINYTYQHPKQPDNTVQDVPNHLANLGANLKLGEHLNSNTTVHYSGNRPREDNDTRDKLTSYMTVDQTFILANFFRTFEVRASIYNLFDRKYADPAPKATIENDFPRPGVSYILEARYKF